MTRRFPHRLDPPAAPRLGIVVLQADEVAEGDLRRLLGPEAELLVSRVASGDEVTPETLSAMAGHLGDATALFPRRLRFDALAYACTSGAAEIGPERVAALLRARRSAAHVTDPVTALIAAARALGIARIGFLSPYLEPVSERIRARLAAGGVDTPVFGSFAIAEEARVARIDAASIVAACRTLAAERGTEALFLSCTNLRAVPLIAALEAEFGLPVMSSNTVLAWHMARLAGAPLARDAPGRLMRATLPGRA